MYHFHSAKIDFREIRFPNVWRGVASFSHKIILALQESRTREAKRIIAADSGETGPVIPI